jgi:hypothetical protein
MQGYAFKPSREIARRAFNEGIMDASIEAAPATEPSTAPEGRESVAEFIELADALAAPWVAHGGERVQVQVERHSATPSFGAPS